MIGRLLVMAVALLSFAPAAAVQLYSVDFSSPPHTVDAKPVVGVGAVPRTLPTSVVGTPLVRSAWGGLGDQPVQVTGYCCSPLQDADDVVFRLDDLTVYPRYAFNFDFAMDAVETNTGYIRIAFGNNERIAFRWNSGTGAVTEVWSRGILTDIGPWMAGQPMNLRIVFDEVQARWWIFIDQVQVFTDATLGASDRPAHLQIATFGKASAAFDSVVIDGSFRTVGVDDESWAAVKDRYR